MMKHEFEELAGYSVSDETYENIIEPMYMALNISKREFVKLIDKKAVALPTKAELIREMRKIAKGIFQVCGMVSTWEEQQKIYELACEYSKVILGHGPDSVWVNVITRPAMYGCFVDCSGGCRTPVKVEFVRGYETLDEITLIK